MRKLVILIFLSGFACSAEGKDINLPKVAANTGVDVIQAIEQRASTRSFSPKEVSMKIISPVLWAGYGIILKEGKKTVHGFDAISGATSSNRYSVPFGWEKPYIRLYLLMKSGAYEYLPKQHKLKFLSKENLIVASGIAATKASGAIIIAVDYSKMTGGKNETTQNVAYLTAGSVSQNMSVVGTAKKIQMLTQVYFNKKKLMYKLDMPRSVEPLAMVSFGYK